MKDMLQRLYRSGMDWIYGVCKTLGIALLVGMTTTVIANIVARYCFDFALSWGEEVARYMMVWLALLGAAMAVRRAAHFRMELLEHHVSPGLRLALDMLAVVSVIALGLLLAIQGWRWTGLTYSQYATATQMRMSYVYAALPLSGILMILFAIERILVGPPVSPNALKASGEAMAENET